MRLSIVIAAYNEGQALVKTVQSCVETCAGLDYEIVVADDASWDGSVEEVAKRFPRLRIVRNVERQGASPTKDRGARAASGEVLIFLDGHAKPERGALRRLADDVQFLKGRAVVTPTIVTLDVARWRNAAVSRGHGYRVDLETFRSDWLPLSDLRAVQEGPRTFYESPAAIGCAFAVTRELYETLWGFDPDMRYWGVEDVDFSLKCWLMGFPILHDPEPVVGHRFQRSFDNYSVPQEQLTANLLRMARKNFTQSTWEAWVEQRRKEHPEGLADHPEGLWAHAWQVFESRRASAEEERAYLMFRRVRDEFWYAERFGLAWPRLRGAGIVPAVGREAAPLMMGVSPSPSPSPPPPPPEPDPEPPCEDDEECCECGCSGEPVRYFNGEVQISATDLSIGGYGKVWQQRRVYRNRLSFNGDVGQGYNWLVEQWPYLIEHADGSITVVRGIRKTLWFDLVEGNYVGRYGAKSTLTHDTGNHQFVLTLPGGEQWRFHDFDQVASPPGLFASQVTRGGQLTSATSYTVDERIEEIQRSAAVDGNTVTQAFRYACDTEGRTTSVTLRQRVNAGAWTDIRRVFYEYYADAESFGSEGDLKRARLQVPQGSVWADSEIDYYRYYKSGAPHGFEHGLKYVVGPKAYARMTADGIDPLTATNGQVAQYADHYFEYDASRRATKEVVDSGSRLFTFAYTTSSFSDGYNNWKVKTTETRLDGSQVIVYTNFIGQILIKELIDGTNRWIENRKYDSDEREVQQASPSAVTGYDDSFANLNVSLKANDGLIHVTNYYAATGGGAAKGYVQFQKIKRGSAGTEVKQAGFEYASHSAGGITVYPISKQTVYRNENGTGAIATSFSYTWYAGTVQIQQQTQTLPVVPTSQNGSGVAATSRFYFDDQGNRTWMMDERGFIRGWKYDLPTGAVTQRIDDVDTSVETDAPSGWTTPSGGGLNLITDYQHDNLGRQTQELGPEHMLDINGTATTVRRAIWTVYLDVTHEVWVGQGYQKVSDSSFTLINPVSITRRDRRGNLLEEIQAVRSSTSGKLQPTDSFPQSSYVRWTTYQYTDCCLAASMRVYHAIPASGEGTEGVNYDQTRYGYDVMKRRNRTVSPGGTITFDVFDVRGLVAATYVGTNDDGATQSDPTGGGADPDNNMVFVTENEYDDGQDGGDGNLTQQTQYVDGSTTRVTAFTSDWRNRQTDIDGELDFYQRTYYDNLDQVVKTERYDTTASGHLVARDETLFDNRGRVYRTVQYAVDPNTGTVGGSLTDNTWFDDAGNVIQRQPAGLMNGIELEYDSLSRLIKQTEPLGAETDVRLRRRRDAQSPHRPPGARDRVRL
jgi:GT2 family glycosyltransferase